MIYRARRPLFFAIVTPLSYQTVTFGKLNRKRNMNKRKFFRAALGYCLLLPLASCSEDEEIIVPPDPVSYTTLVYMAADNSMDSEVDLYHLAA